MSNQGVRRIMGINISSACNNIPRHPQVPSLSCQFVWKILMNFHHSGYYFVVFPWLDDQVHINENDDVEKIKFIFYISYFPLNSKFIAINTSQISDTNRMIAFSIIYKIKSKSLLLWGIFHNCYSNFFQLYNNRYILHQSNTFHYFNKFEKKITVLALWQYLHENHRTVHGIYGWMPVYKIINWELLTMLMVFFLFFSIYM